MTVTVAVPYFGVPDLVERAVRSILDQTYPNLRLIVVGDGEEPPLAKIRDPRLTVYTLPENRGTYFCFQLMLHASPDEWHAPHGADDWCDPEHLETLLALKQDAVGLGTTWVHDPEPTLTSIGKEGWHVGIFSAERLRAIGGYDPSSRVSQDTLLLKLLDAHGGYHRLILENPTYHVWRHVGSLTMTPKTGMNSPYRNRARAYNNAIVARSRKMSIPQVKAFRDSLVPQAVHEELAEHVERLRRYL